LRGINIGPNNRVPMPALREALTAAGFDNVRTYVQSGNVLVDSTLKPARVRDHVERLLADDFDLTIPVVTRTGADLARIVEANPLPEAAQDPKRYQVSFLSDKLASETAERLQKLATESERFVVDDLELYTWHPDGVARSKLANGLAGKLGAGVVATARNWTTVTKLLEMASE
jgi:uncharacterized protein (DUF1697 family)